MAERRTMNPEDERAHLITVKGELDAAQTKDEVIAVWKRHYLTIGHRKLGRLLVGQSVDAVVRGGRARE